MAVKKPVTLTDYELCRLQTLAKQAAQAVADEANARKDECPVRRAHARFWAELAGKLERMLVR